MVRLSLKTGSKSLAMSIISDVLTKIELQGGTNAMEKPVIDKLVRETITCHLGRIGSVFGEKNSYDESLFKTYQRRRLHQQFTPNFEESAPLPSYYEYKIQQSFPNDSPSDSTSKLFSKLFTKDEVTSVDFLDLDKNLFEAEEKVERFFSKVNYIKNLLASNDLDEAEKVFNSLKECHRNSLSFSEAVDAFFKAGKAGKLPLSKSYKGMPWTDRNLSNYLYSFKIFSAHFGDQMMQDIDGEELDLFFSEIVSNLPKKNISPFNRMTYSKLIECTAGGQVEEDQIISGKNVFEHYKRMKTFYSFYEQTLKGSSKAFAEMRFQTSEENNKRGAFTSKQVSKIIKFVDSLSEGKKWPINIMAYTGMRNAEVMQLRKEDVAQNEDGIWFFTVTENAGSLKTANSNRVVPIHNDLIDKGLIEFVLESADTYLFRRFSESDKYLTRIYSSHIKPKCGIPQESDFGEKLNLYSLRHFVITSLVDAGGQTPYIQAIVGHQKSVDTSVTTKHYTHTNNMKLMQQIINKIVIN